MKAKDGFGVDDAILQATKADFESERVSDKETVATIKHFYSSGTPAATNRASNGTNGTSHQGGYVLDPHSAVGIAFANAVDLALKHEKGFSFDAILPEQFVGLDDLEKRVRLVRKEAGIGGMRNIIREEVARELEGR
ncbi:MAG: hypothetical protein FRX48_06842 [Lasallia pustulata]|uniref:Uncharacterized protein n=1 Tax=Lasallia pustulata TaxID=136370 RepID=A0A5M8PIQ7_9LECA|nr:MAG: hypothetical protein FRX48_06842 [Lasallia pustulata]